MSYYYCLFIAFAYVKCNIYSILQLIFFFFQLSAIQWFYSFVDGRTSSFISERKRLNTRKNILSIIDFFYYRFYLIINFYSLNHRFIEVFSFVFRLNVFPSLPCEYGSVKRGDFGHLCAIVVYNKGTLETRPYKIYLIANKAFKWMRTLNMLLYLSFKIFLKNITKDIYPVLFMIYFLICSTNSNSFEIDGF